MSAVDKIKSAAADLTADEQVEVFRWWVESPAFRQRQLELLEREIALGVEDLERGRYQTYSGADVTKLAEDISRAGRKRLAKSKSSRQ